MEKQIVVINPLTSEDAIYNKILELYESNTRFIIHIIRSHFPGKTKRVISFLNENLKNRRCCISDLNLIDLYSVAKEMSKRDNVPYDIIIHSLADIRTPIQVINKEAGNKTLALIGEKSDKMLSIKGYNQLMKFVADEFNKNNYLIKKVVYEEFAKTLKNDALKRFDFSIPYHKLPKNIKDKFNIYINERFIPFVKNLDDYIIWNMMSNRNN